VLTPTIDEPDVRSKGADEVLDVWLKSEAGPQAVTSGQALGEGDEVQLGYRLDGPWVSFAGRDASGQIEVYGSFEVGEGHALMPFGLELDGSSGEQEFFAVQSEGPLNEGQVRTAIHEGGDAVLRVAVPKR
jgi:hypothetical protein